MKKNKPYQHDLSNNFTRIFEEISKLENSEEILSKILPLVDFNEDTVALKLFAGHQQEFTSPTKDNMLNQLSEATIIKAISPSFFIQKYDTYPDIPFNYLALSGRHNYFKAYLDAYLDFRAQDSKTEKIKYSPHSEARYLQEGFDNIFEQIIEHNYQGHAQIKNNIAKPPLQFVDDIFNAIDYFIEKVGIEETPENKIKSRQLFYADTYFASALRQKAASYQAALYLTLQEYEKCAEKLKSQKISFKQMIKSLEGSQQSRSNEQARKEFLNSLSNVDKIDNVIKQFDFIVSQKNSAPEIDFLLKEIVEHSINKYLLLSQNAFAGSVFMSYGLKDMRDETLLDQYHTYLDKKEKVKFLETSKAQQYVAPVLKEQSAQNLTELFAAFRNYNPRFILDTLELYERNNVAFDLSEAQPNRYNKKTTLEGKIYQLNTAEVVYLFRYAEALYDNKILKLPYIEENKKLQNKDFLQKSLDAQNKEAKGYNDTYRLSETYLLRQAQINHLQAIDKIDFNEIYTKEDLSKVDTVKMEKVIMSGMAETLFRWADIKAERASPQLMEKIHLDRQISNKNGGLGNSINKKTKHKV